LLACSRTPELPADERSSVDAAPPLSNESTMPPPREPLAPIPPEQYRVEVRPMDTLGGGPGWVSSESVAVLERIIANMPNLPPDQHQWAGLIAFSHHEGRIPDRLRENLARVTDPEGDHARAMAELISEDPELFQNLCGNLDAVFERVSTLPDDDRLTAMFDGCQLARFGVLKREQAASAPLAVIGHGILLHLQRTGGLHPTETVIVEFAVGARTIGAESQSITTKSEQVRPP
jgi:hypothetical protein